MGDHLVELRRWWKQSPNCSFTVTSPARIEELERRYDVSLPEDFRTYLLTSSPVNELSDNECTSWWDFDRIRNIPDEYKYEIKNPQVETRKGQYLFFADYSNWCWAWALCCTNDENRGKVAMINGVNDCFVADSFSEFVQKYLRDFRLVC